MPAHQRPLHLGKSKSSPDECEKSLYLRRIRTLTDNLQRRANQFRAIDAEQRSRLIVAIVHVGITIGPFDDFVFRQVQRNGLRKCETQNSLVAVQREGTPSLFGMSKKFFGLRGLKFGGSAHRG